MGLPIRTLCLGAATVVVAALPGVSESLQLEAGLTAVLEPWRLLTGHFAHWSVDHLVWDLLVFVVLASVWEREAAAAWGESAKEPWLCVVVAALLISFAVLLVPTTPMPYRGLSGIDSALFVALALRFFGRARQAGRKGLALALAALLGLFVAKVGYEAATGLTLFVDSAAAGFQPVPLAHLVGGAVGCAFGWSSSYRSSKTAENPKRRNVLRSLRASFLDSKPRA